MNHFTFPKKENNYLEDYIQLVTNSLKDLANIEIVDFSLSTEEQAKQVFEADYVLLSHNASDDPTFIYANQTALNLFEMTWEEFTGMPSRYSAEADERGTREAFLKEVKLKGYSSNYSGVRISKTGRRFRIKDVLLWNVFDSSGKRIGQAAMFDKYEYID